MTAIDVEVQVGTAPLVDVDVQLEPPTFTVISVLPTGPRGPAGPQGDTGATGADGAPGADGQDGADGAPGQDGADGAPGLVQSIVPGVNITVDDTDPANPIVSSTSGSGLPEQWSDGGNGNVTATVDDPAKTALTVEAVTGQTAPLVDLKDEDSGTAFAIVSHVPAVDDVWTINGIAGAPIVADAGDYTIGSLFMDPTYPNTGQAPAVVVSVGDDAATIEAAFDAAIGAGLVTVTGDWSDLTLHFVPPDGVVYGHFLYIAANALTQGAVPVVDPTTINTTVGHTANIEEAGPYGRAFGKVTPSGINGQPTLFDPDAKSWQERGYVGWLWTEAIVQDTMGFGKPNKLTLHRFAQRGMTTRPENIGDNAEVHTGVFEIQALSDDDAAYVQEYIQIEIAPDGSHRRGYFEFHNDLNDGTVGQVAQDPVVSIETNDDYTQQRLKALPGQTEPLFIFRDENAADVGRVMPDGLVISNARTLPDVADLAIGDHGSVCDPIAQTVTLFMKNDAGNLCLAEIPMTEIP